ncbi:MAG TPA: protein-glutamate O-methyltransferase CheR [candidate division Zixibacteria bacterium]|nr:protein-glutamate O-methyltransferase CheR [candidate division Zixibacteria bacterium]
MLNNPDMTPDMTPEEFVMIRDFIHQRCGIYFAESKMYLLKNRLITRMSELNIKTYRDYFYAVKYDSSNTEFGQLINLVTTNETYFFRNEPQLRSFSEELLPQLVKQAEGSRFKRPIKIWSAGCSTGEEPYTLAMLILDKLGPRNNLQFEIIANDISEQVLKKARVGEYTGQTLRYVKPNVLAKHFTRKENSEVYLIKPEVRSMVRFSHINLADQRQVARHSDIDIIFCRNVMIYFSDQMKSQIVRGFYNSLRPGGHFYIGHSETLHGLTKAFKLVYLKNSLVYHKENLKVENRSNGLRGMNTTTSIGTTSGASRALDLLSKVKPVTAGTK